MHISQAQQHSSTDPNRIIILLHSFAELLLRCTKGFDKELTLPYIKDKHYYNNYNSDDIINIIINKFGSPKDLDKYFDKFTIEFGQWLLQRTPRTLEHPMEDLLTEFREQCKLTIK